MLTSSNWSLFQSLYQTILIISESYYQTRVDSFSEFLPKILHTFPDIKQNWHFQSVAGKQYYTLFESLYQAILTVSESSF